MKSIIKIGLVGDFDAEIMAHQCIPEALKISATQLNLYVQPEWLLTSELKNLNSDRLSKFDGFWCVPGSPYKDRAAVLKIIQHARQSQKPYLGTCGGYQHAILEFAINKLNYKHAELEEENPQAEMLLINALSCRLNDENKKIHIQDRSKLHSVFQEKEISEQYRCGFGMNPKYKNIFDDSDLKFVAFNDEEIPQAFELRSHPFFIGTAFQPERSARQKINHPLVAAFIQACAI